MPNHPTGRIDSQELKSLGFPEQLIAEAVERENSGVNAYRPPSDLLERTLAACAAKYPELTAEAERSAEQPPSSIHQVVWTALKASFEVARKTGNFDLVAAAHLARASIEMPGALPLHYTAALAFALKERRRPLLILENHNLIDPKWWMEDPFFRSLRDACGEINRKVTAQGIEPTARVIVLRADEADYSEAELQTINRLLDEATSDIWFLSQNRAGSHAKHDVAIIGDQEVFLIDHKASSPQETLTAAQLTTNRDKARTARQEFRQLLVEATPIKIKGQFVAEPLTVRPHSNASLKSFLGAVIHGTYSAPALGPGACMV